MLNNVKVCGSHVLTLLDSTPIFEWYMAILLVINNLHKNTCDNEIELGTQNTNITLYDYEYK